jgi:hypothetical protein
MLVMQISKKCSECGISFSVFNYNKDIAKVCSVECNSKRRKRLYIKSKHPQWKGGLSLMDKICLYCNLHFLGRQNRKFCSCRCSHDWNILNKTKQGKNNGMWTGGRHVDKDGYIAILNREHPNRNYKGYVLEHRLAVVNYIGRPLRKNEVVHHINNIKTDNRLDNLSLLTKKQHDRLKKDDVVLPITKLNKDLL